nr:unnamed protein product [Digitaria exilis]
MQPELGAPVTCCVTSDESLGLLQRIPIQPEPAAPLLRDVRWKAELADKDRRRRTGGGIA